MLNTLRLRQNGRHFTDDIFKCIFLNKSVWILIKISLKFVPKGPINNIPALVQIMACRRPGDKPLSEPMIVRVSTHICVTRPQWVKDSREMFPGLKNISLNICSLCIDCITYYYSAIRCLFSLSNRLCNHPRPVLTFGYYMRLTVHVSQCPSVRASTLSLFAR